MITIPQDELAEYLPRVNILVDLLRGRKDQCSQHAVNSLVRARSLISTSANQEIILDCLQVIIGIASTTWYMHEDSEIMARADKVYRYGLHLMYSLYHDDMFETNRLDLQSESTQDAQD